jgi:APA family basic amino acid/polyamine antiporter
LLVVSSVIGVGIFLTPGTVADILPHPGLLMAAWMVGGLLSLCGGLANAELAAMYPHAGGDYVYLREAYHPLAGFVVGWLSFFVIFAGTIATLAVGFAEGLSQFIVLGSAGRGAVAVFLIIATSALNYLDVRTGARINNSMAAIKILTLVGLVVAGALFGKGDTTHFRPFLVGAQDIPATAFGLALSPILFSYLGWNASVYVGSEIRDPQRSIPQSLFAGLGICMLTYLFVNAIYLYALPVNELRAEVRVGEAAALALFGPAGGRFVAVLILVSIGSCLNATILVGPRIAYAMALDRLFFSGVDRVHVVHRTPHVALVAQALTAIALIVVLERFPSVLDYTTFAIVLATMADTTALYALRFRRPDLHRPYRAWGYPFLPAAYLVANGLIAWTMLRGRPFECGIALAVAATALPFYALFVRRHVGSPPASSDL